MSELTAPSVRLLSDDRLLPDSSAGIEVLAKFFAGLSDATRLKLLDFVVPEEHSVSECVAHVGLSQGRVSTHLRCLADCGYVRARRVGRRVLYRVADPRVAELVVLGQRLAAVHDAQLVSCRQLAADSTVDRA
ncbi:MAG: ArsR/SmtB family transcription factor [Micromonosporaceae bacterium]